VLLCQQPSSFFHLNSAFFKFCSLPTSTSRKQKHQTQHTHAIMSNNAQPKKKNDTKGKEAMTPKSDKTEELSPGFQSPFRVGHPRLNGNPSYPAEELPDSFENYLKGGIKAVIIIMSKHKHLGMG